jgi:hypothetical protein
MLELVWSKFKNVLIVGDLNADISRSVNNDVSSIPGKKLLRTLEHFNYSIMNDQPTGVTTSSSTLIDHVISIKPETIKETKTLELGISDHMLVYVSLKTKLRRPPPKIINARSYRKFDLNEFRKDVEKAPWSVCLMIWKMSTGRGVIFSTTFAINTLHTDKSRLDRTPCHGSLRKLGI